MTASSDPTETADIGATTALGSLRFVRSTGPVAYICTAEGCDVETFVAVESADGGWDGSAVCDNEQHIAEVLTCYGGDA